MKSRKPGNDGVIVGLPADGTCFVNYIASLAHRFYRALLVSAVLVGFGVVLGLQLAEQFKTEFSLPSRVVKKLERGAGSVFMKGRPVQKLFHTNRLNLAVTEFYLPAQVKNGGGGIASDHASGG